MITKSVHNIDFNCGEFALIKKQTRLNSNKISVNECIVFEIEVEQKALRHDL